MTSTPTAASTKPQGHQTEEDESDRYEALKIWGGVALLCVLGLVLCYIFLVEPPPPRQLTIATGGKNGAYYAYAKAYAEVLAEYGIELQVRETAGSIENLRLLTDEGSGVPVGFAQSGVIVGGEPELERAARQELEALGSCYREPLWLFYRGESVRTLMDLTGRSVSVGPPGSGTRAVVKKMLGLCGMSLEDLSIQSMGSTDAAEAVAQGRLDAAFFVVGPEAGYFNEILLPAMQDEGNPLMLAHFERAESYERAFPFLAGVRISRGLLSMAHDLPRQDTRLVSPTATLVARQDLHPAIVPLLLQAVRQVHGGRGLLDEVGEFPSTRFTDLPMNQQAARYIQEGPSFLYRFLPFGLASMIDRLKVMIIPLITLCFPLFKAAPPLYRIRIRSKIYRWYEQLREADLKIREGAKPGELRQQRDEIDRIDRELPTIRVPLSYMEEFYNLRLHIEFVQRRLAKAIEAAAGRSTSDEASNSKATTPESSVKQDEASESSGAN